MEARYITDASGKRQSVILSIEEYERLLQALEDLEDLRAADEALAEIARGEDELIPWEQAKREMDEERADLRRRGEL